MPDDTLRALDELGAEFERVASATGPSGGPRRPSPRRRVLVLAVAATLLAGTGAVAASQGLFGEPVKNPPGATFTPERGLGTPVAGSIRVTGLRVADPDGGPPWGLRVLRTSRGMACVQIGRVVDGRLGVLGRNGAFGDDGRFHELPAGVLAHANCQQTDGAGNAFLAISYQGLPASGFDRGCVVERAPRAVRLHGTATRLEPPLCRRQDLRVVYHGLLGPQGESVTYEDDRGARATADASGPDGAYLVVLRPDRGRRIRGFYSFGATPASGLESVRYRNGERCRIRSPRRRGGARPCPPVGYVPPRSPAATSAEVSSPVRARVSARPVRPPGSSGLPAQATLNWKLTVSFTARVAANARSPYVISVRPARRQACRFGTLSGTVDRDVSAGQVVREIVYIPRRCRGIVRGSVVLSRPPRSPQPVPGPVPAHGDPRVGSFEARIPPRRR